MPKRVLPGFAVLCATSLWLNSAGVSAAEQPAPTMQNVQQWNGKFVVLNFFGNRRFHVTVLRNAGIACHSARQNRPLIGAQNRPPCGWYSVEESSYSVLLARGVIRS